jgi:two-component system response regulator FixJ
MIPDDACVYVVDDDASFVRSALRLLASWGIHAEGFTSALEFLARRPAAGRACALVDLRMPGVNGLDLQEALVAARAALPVVFMSGHTDAQSRVDAMCSGAVDFLTKPVDERRLLAALELALADEAERDDRAPLERARPGPGLPRRAEETRPEERSAMREPGLSA